MTQGSRPRRSAHACSAALLVVIAGLMPVTAGAQATPRIPRVRSADPFIAQLIAEAPAASPTFLNLVDTIDTTNGIVYVDRGQCGHGVQACLTHSIHVAGPHRILRVLVNTRRDRDGLMASVGHELQHAAEVLRDPGITTTQGMFFHLFGMSMGTSGRFETREAIEAGAQIERELREARQLPRTAARR